MRAQQHHTEVCNSEISLALDLGFIDINLEQSRQTASPAQSSLSSQRYMPIGKMDQEKSNVKRLKADTTTPVDDVAQEIEPP